MISSLPAQSLRVFPHVLLPAALVLTSVLHAQNTSPTPRSLLSNGNMERSFSSDNLWDGVDSSGNLAVERATVQAVTSSGSVNPTSMPPSVVARDFNGDGKTDLLVADPVGYFRLYLNSGTKEEPKFTHNDIHSVFLSADSNRKAPRMSLAAFRNPSGLDLLVGNYLGEIMLLPSINAGALPSWSQPRDLPSVTIPTFSNNRLWGNLFAPAAHDMNGDGRLDLLVGEGSYSANSIHLLLNQASNASPKFDERQRFFLITGDGREQLVPALIDANADGFMDVIVGDRTGTATLHINPGSSWKPGQPFKSAQDLTFSGRASLGGAITPYAADMNGDGKFDLLLGRANGRISLAFNTGTNEKPVFAAPTDIKGQNVDPQRLRLPSGWNTDFKSDFGNAFATIQIVTSEDDPQLAPPEGKSALRMGYLPTRNKNLPDYNVNTSPQREPNQMKTFRVWTTVRLENNASYELKFFSKGTQAISPEWSVKVTASKTVGEEKIERGERGIVKRTADDRREKFTANGSIRTGSVWGQNTSRFKVEFRDRELRGNGVRLNDPIIEFTAVLPGYNSELYIDDVQLIKVQ